MPNENGTLIFLIVLIVSAFAISAVKLTEFLKRFNKETEDITMGIQQARDNSECRYWRRKLRCHYLCLIPFVNEHNVMGVYHFFYHRLRHTKKKTRNDGLFHILAPSIIGACICAVCLFGATWAWFTVSCSSAVSTLTAATYTVEVSAEVIDTQEEPVMMLSSAQEAPTAAPTEDVDPTDEETTEESAEEVSAAEQTAMDNASATEPEAADAENDPVEIEEETGSEADKAEEVAPSTTEPTEQTEDEGKKAEMHPAYAPAAANGGSTTPPVVTPVNGGYEIYLESGKTYKVTITATGTATTGYCTVKIGDDTYYTPQIAQGDIFEFTVTANESVTLTIIPQWGTYSGEEVTVNGQTPLEYGTSAVAKGGNSALSLPKETVDDEKSSEETENGDPPALPDDTDDNGEDNTLITETPADHNGNDATPDETQDVEQQGSAQAEEDTQPTEPEQGEEGTA